MKVLLFGSNGLVGSSIKRLLSTTVNKEKYNGEFSTRKDTNLFSYKETKDKIDSFKPDIIINAAAKVGGIHANNTNRTTFLIENLKINLNILESCKNINPIKIINLGSSCIYPLNAPNPISEESIMTGKLEETNSPYAMAKLTSIELGNAIKREHGHKVVNLMPTNLYGPNDNFSENQSHVIPGLVHRMHIAKKNNETVFKIWGSGNPLREFLHVDDLSSSILFLIENSIDEELINIGSGKEVSISDLAKIIKNIIGYSGELTFNKDMPDGNPRKLLDSSKIQKLGWKPKISLEEGISNTYKWYLENIN